MKIRFVTTIATFFITAGLVIGYGPYMQYIRNHKHQNLTTFSSSRRQVLSANTIKEIPEQVKVTLEGVPVRINIPSLSIDLTVINGYYNALDQTWTLTQDMAQYATNTPLANNTGGNTFIYGHNINKVFARLKNAKVGDQVIIYTSNGHIFTYNFIDSIETNPNDDSLFAYKGKPILTIQTCSGVWSQNRQLFTFDLVGAI